MATILNDNDKVLQGAAYRDKTTLSTITTSVSNFTTAKNGGITTPASTTLSASANSVFSAAAVYTWDYAISSAPTAFKPLKGALIQGSTTFVASGTGASTSSATWISLGQLSTSGSGIGATFQIVKSGGSYSYVGKITVTILNPGIGYVAGDTIIIGGANLGGTATNNLTLTIGGSLSTNIGITQIVPSTTILSMIGTTRSSSISFRSTITETLLDSAIGYTVVSHGLESATNDPILVDISRSSVVLPSSNSGAVSTYLNTDVIIRVSRGGAYLIYDATGASVVGGAATSAADSFSVEIVPETGAVTRTLDAITTPTTTSWKLGGLTDLAIDYSIVSFNVYVYDASGNKTALINRSTSYTKARTGSIGEPAVLYYIDPSSPVIYKSASNVTQDGAHTAVTVYSKRSLGTSASTTFYGYVTITANDGTEAPTATPMTSAGISLAPNPDSGKTSYIVRMYSGEIRNTAGVLLLDSQTIPVLFTGSSALTVLLTNEVSSIPVNITGGTITGAYAGTAGLIRVYEGTKELTFDQAFDANNANQTAGTYTVTASSPSSLIVPGTISKAAYTKYATIGQASSIGANTATVTYSITGKSFANQAFTSSKDQSFAKAYPGSDAVLSYIALSSPVVYKAASSYIAEGTHTNFTATGKQTIGNGAPVSYGYITITPVVAITNTTASTNLITCSSTASFVLNTPIVFSGTTSGGITIGIIYYIKTINNTNKTITISASITSGVAGNVLSLSTTVPSLLYASNEAATATQYSITTAITNDFAAVQYLVKMYDSQAKTSLLDSATLPILFQGTNNVVPVITNENSTIPADAGVAISGGYDNTTTDIQVFEGVKELTYDGVGQTAGKFNVTATGSGITAGSVTTVSGAKYATVTAAGNMPTNTLTATVNYVISGLTTAGVTFSVAKKQTFNKSNKGTNGIDGLNSRIAIVTAYAWATSQPSLSGNFKYTWATQAVQTETGIANVYGAVGSYPTGWTAEAGSPTADGQRLFLVTVTIANNLTTANTVVAWNSGKVSTVGFRKDGIGIQGDSARLIYITLTGTNGNLPAAPAIPVSALNSGADDVPAGWSATFPTTALTAGQAVFQSDGIWNYVNNKVVWQTPYLSNLKVGSLSAISANLGFITGGNINIGSGKFIVDTDGTVTIKGADTGARLVITTNSIKIYDTAGLRVQLGDLTA